MTAQFLRLSLFLAICLPGALFGQIQPQIDVAARYITLQSAQWGYSDKDIKDVIVSDAYQSSNKAYHVYFNQRFQGVEVYNALVNIHILPTGKVFYSTHGFIADLSSKIQGTKPSIDQRQAVLNAFKAIGVSNPELQEIPSDRKDVMVFKKGKDSRSNIPVRLKYMPMTDGSVRLAWDLSIDAAAGTDYWSMRIDAQNGAVLDQISWTQHCKFEANQYGHQDQVGQAAAIAICHDAIDAQSSQVNAAGAIYNVYALPFEAPNFGGRSLVNDPANINASPYGWHDIDGETGADYTTTQGNNGFAFPDRDGDYAEGADLPDAGASLQFDYPINLGLEPSTYTAAATTNLFYMINMMHDFTYAYGFDEVSGNFQFNNYDRGGLGGDHVNALAQFNADGGTNLNNADFSTPGDGGSGQMRMFEWTQSGQSVVTVNLPLELAGGVESSTATFGSAVTSVPLTGTVALAYDATSQASEGCFEIQNGDEIAGKIAMVDRGTCFFIEKTLNVEAKGAIACIVCNYENTVIPMGPGAGFDNPGIPAVMLKSTDCQRIKQAIAAGKQVDVTLVTATQSGPIRYDGSLDNGIIAHEFGHGVSNRLTGGPAQAGCLSNAEQMGEGWSDFLALVTTVKDGDTGAKSRGVGTYVFRQTTDGLGIRKYPYSTDLNVSPQTYEDLVGITDEHASGEIWADMLWELYWKMVAKYGYDSDFIFGTGGNNKAIRLVMDGMRLQSCSPGFIDGRDAILAADVLNYVGVNQCLIWEAFAKRGLGFSANQGNSNNLNDGKAGFDVEPHCIAELKMTKSATEVINAGDIVDVTLTLTNHKLGSVNNVSVTDPIANGLTYVSGSANLGGQISGGVLTFNIPSLATDETIQLKYKATSDPSNKSLTQFYDGMEGSDNNWIFEAVTGALPWKISNLEPNVGSKAWFAEGSDAKTQTNLYLLVPKAISGNVPVLSLMHQIQSQPGLDGGFFEISADGGGSYQDLQPYIFKNSYSAKIAYNTFSKASQRAYSGNSMQYINSLVDLSAFAGKEVSIRFRFGTDDTQFVSGGNLGWFIDELYIMDALFYNSEACVSTTEGDNVCASAPYRGTLVKGSTTLGTKYVSSLPWNVQIMPNPAQEEAQVLIGGISNKQVNLRLLNLQGAVYFNQWVSPNGSSIPLDLKGIPSGMYLVQITDGTQSGLYKLIKR